MVFWAGTALLFYAPMNYANLLAFEAKDVEKAALLIKFAEYDLYQPQNQPPYYHLSVNKI